MMPGSTTIDDRRIEEASLNAWPALHQMLLDGWLLRFSRGFTKRANCIVPLYPVRQPMAEKIRYCENLYARERLQTIFRLTSLTDADDLDGYLESLGYARIDPTDVLRSPLIGQKLPEPRAIRCLGADEWLGAYAKLTAMPASGQALHRAIVGRILGDCAFAVIETPDGEPLACALAVLEQNLVGLFDVFTHPGHRRRGHAAQLVGELLGWARTRGATHAYLQMIASNEAARALYGGFGFEPAYTYWYRTSP